MSKFPIVLIPRALKQITMEFPPLPTIHEPESPKDPIAPVPPTKPTKLELQQVIWIGIITSLLFFSINVSLGIFSVVVLTVAWIWYEQWLDNSFPQIEQKYQQDLVRFEQRKRGYQEELDAMPARRRQHQLDLEAHKQKLIRLKAEYRQPEKVVAFRRKRLCEVLKHTLPHDGEDSRAIEGANEHRLRHRLEHFFHGRIYTRLTVSIPNYEYPYSPDITYIDTTLGLYIDIEVDEPYDYYSGQPTHELNGEKDARRDQFFLRRGGIVIRFSEEQVVCASESCCKEVAKTIASLTGDPTIPAQFENVPDLVSMPQWTYTEAAEMALNRVRDRGYECRNFPQSVPRTSGISPASGSTLTPDELLNRLTESMRQRRSQAESSRRVRSQQQDRSSLPTPPAPNSQTFNTQPPKNPPTVQSRSPVQPPSDAQRPTKKTPPVQPNNSENRGRSWRRNRRKKLKMKLANSQTTESEARGYIQTALELGVIEQNEFSKFMDYFINRDNNNA